MLVASFLFATMTHDHLAINSYNLEMYKRVSKAQNDILKMLGDYIDDIPNKSVVAIQLNDFKKTENHFWYPFNDSWGLRAAIRGFYQRRDLMISTSFNLHQDHVTFWDKEKKYKYSEVIFFDYDRYSLIPLRGIEVNGKVKTTKTLS